MHPTPALAPTPPPAATDLHPCTAMRITASHELSISMAIPSPAATQGIRDRQWHLDVLSNHEAHKLSLGAGGTIRVIDTGSGAEHPDNAAKVVALSEDADLKGDTRHSTNVASVATEHSDDDAVMEIPPLANVLSGNVFSGHVLSTDAPRSDVNAVAQAMKCQFLNSIRFSPS